MRRKKQGNTFLNISSQLSSIQTCQTPWGFLLPSVWTGATLRSKSEIFLFEFFFFSSEIKLLRYYQWSPQTEVRNRFD